MRKKEIRHINDSLSDFTSSDESGDSDEEKIKDIRLIFFTKEFLKIYFLRE